MILRTLSTGAKGEGASSTRAAKKPWSTGDTKLLRRQKLHRGFGHACVCRTCTWPCSTSADVIN